MRQHGVREINTTVTDFLQFRELKLFTRPGANSSQYGILAWHSRENALP